MKNQAQPPALPTISPQFKRDMATARVKDFLTQVGRELERAQTWLISTANVLDAGGAPEQAAEHLRLAIEIMAESQPYARAAAQALKEMDNVAGNPDLGAKAAHSG